MNQVNAKIEEQITRKILLYIMSHITLAIPQLHSFQGKFQEKVSAKTKGCDKREASGWRKSSLIYSQASPAALIKTVTFFKLVFDFL